ncbi:MAG: TolC family protein, partial [Alloprevotella sp.]
MKHLFSLFAITLSTACGLTGCHLHKDYERDPSLLSLDSLRLSSTAVLGDSTMADTIVRSSVVCWERFYADSCLRLLIREGLAHNSDLRTAQLRTEEAMASLSAAKKALLPSADFVANGAVSSFDGGKATKTYSIGAEISWEADIFRRLTAAKRREAAAVEEKMCYEQAVRSQLIATIACHYFSLAALDRKVEISEEHIGSQEEYVRTLEALLSAGQSDRPTIRQAEAALLSARAQLAKQKLQLTETENSLLTLLGRQGGSIRRSALSDLCIPTFWEKGVRVDLLAARPDVREAEARLKQAFHGEQIARANFYPSLTLSGTVGWTNNGGAGVSNPGAILLSAAAGVVQPLFRRGELKKELRVAQLQREE